MLSALFLTVSALRMYLLYFLEQGYSTFCVRGPIFIFHIILRAAVIADYKIIMDILNNIIGASLLLRHSSFSSPSAALPTSQLIPQPFHCFTYVIDTSLSHSSFSNPSADSSTPQLILQPFRRFIYVTGDSITLPLLHLRHKHFTYFTWRTAHA